MQLFPVQIELCGFWLFERRTRYTCAWNVCYLFWSILSNWTQRIFEQKIHHSISDASICEPGSMNILYACSIKNISNAKNRQTNVCTKYRFANATAEIVVTNAGRQPKWPHGSNSTSDTRVWAHRTSVWTPYRTVTFSKLNRTHDHWTHKQLNRIAGAQCESMCTKVPHSHILNQQNKSTEMREPCARIPFLCVCVTDIYSAEHTGN